MGKLENRVALITGAASGIGREQSILFAKEGAKVIAADINFDEVLKVAEEVTAQGGDIFPVYIDMGNLEDIKKALKVGMDKYGQIDIISNTAAVFDAWVPSLKTPEELWDRIMDVNLKGIYRLTNLVLPQMIARGKGTIVNISSDAGLVAACGGAAYTSSKHGLIGYTKQLSSDYGQKGIKVNAIAPGAIMTNMTRKFFEHPDTMAMVNACPAGRVGRPEDIAQLALFLASDDSDYIHGAIIPVDGGLTVR